MKERPILFSGPMVRAILEGRKAQTRRVVKCRGQWTCECPDSDEPWPYFENELGEWEFFECPYGAIGDRLWVREAFKVSDVRHAPDDHGTMIYTADSTSIEIDGSEFDMNRIKLGKSYPSIHMPRLASRITLEITGVRVERLQEISGDDAKAEGVQPIPFSNGTAKAIWEPGYGASGQDSYTPAFQSLWQSINGPESWSANPWVWVIEFRRITE